MKIDIGPLLRGETDNIVVDYQTDIEPVPDVTFTDKAKVCGKVSGNAGYTRLCLTVSVPYVAECARCLEPVSGIFETTLERTCVTEKTVSREELEENEDEYLLIKDTFIDPDEPVNITVYFEFPKKLLCREDCRGLCPKCGKRLEDGHSCEKNQNKLDSRFAILEKVLDNE